MPQKESSRNNLLQIKSKCQDYPHALQYLMSTLICSQNNYLRLRFGLSVETHCCVCCFSSINSWRSTYAKESSRKKSIERSTELIGRCPASARPDVCQPSCMLSLPLVKHTPSSCRMPSKKCSVGSSETFLEEDSGSHASWQGLLRQEQVLSCEPWPCIILGKLHFEAPL